VKLRSSKQTQPKGDGGQATMTFLTFRQLRFRCKLGFSMSGPSSRFPPNGSSRTPLRLNARSSERHFTSSLHTACCHQSPAFAPVYPEDIPDPHLSVFTAMPRPKVTIFGTGGTIAGSAADACQTTGYAPAVLTVDALIREVPELGQAAQLRSEQLVNVGSPDITSAQLLRMAQRIQKELDGDCHGVVVTHGTDTIEETAFFLELTIQSDKPVVLVGAMRPATAHSADGPMNLLCGVNLAANRCAKKRGVMIVLNDRICAPRFTTKTNANSLDSFKATEQGYLGVFVNSQPVFYYPPCRPLSHNYFNVTRCNAAAGLPDVDILYGHLGLRSGLFKAAVDQGAGGIVLAGMGAGCWNTEDGKRIMSFVEKRGKAVPVVASRRTAWGFVGGTSNYGLGDSCIGGGFLDPHKCRIQLQLALAAGLDAASIREVFEGNRPGAAVAESRIREWRIL